MKKGLFAAFIFALSTFFSFSIAQTKNFGADRHVQKGVQCQVCHGPDLKKPAFPDSQTCLKCHDQKVIAEKTKNRKQNPHTAPHNNDCTLCHMQHEEPVDYCAQCHKFDLKPNK